MSSYYLYISVLTAIVVVLVATLVNTPNIQKPYQNMILEKPMQLNLNGVSDIKINMTPCVDVNGMVLKY
jgi:hypothetical protein